MADDYPVQFDEALASHARRQIMPTDLGTADLRELDSSLRAQSFFSAHTLNEDLLAGYKDEIEKLLSGDQSDPYARQRIKEILKEIGYEPEPDKEGTLEDLSSNARINLVLRTNVELAQGEGWWVQGQKQAILDQWPAQELYRAGYRMKPRAWLEYRWPMAGRASGSPIGDGWTITPDNRMIALKNHPIWEWIGSSALFPDALDVIWPPFAFNSGMWVRDVDRETAVNVGILKPMQRVTPLTLADVLKPLEAML